MNARHFSGSVRLCALAALLCLLAFAGAAQAAAPRGQKAVDETLRRLSLEEKIGQTLMVFFKGDTLTPETAERLKAIRAGGVILYSQPGNIGRPPVLAALNRDLQNLAQGYSQGLAMFIGIDQEGGPVARLREGYTWQPSQMALAAAGGPELAAEAARIEAAELTALGINVSFSPVADVNSNPKNPIIGVRSFGSDTAGVSRRVAAVVKAYTQAGVLCTPKHFPGHGDTEIDSHVGLPVLRHGLDRLARVDFPPFEAAIAAGARAVMSAHVALPEVNGDMTPATLSQKVLGGLLRGRLGFKGLVFSDSLGMGALKNSMGIPEAALAALKAGCDVLLLGADKGVEPEVAQDIFNRLVEAARSGELPQSRLDEACRRVLAAKAEFGVLSAKQRAAAINPETILSRVDTEASRRFNAQVAAKALCLVRGGRGGLPLGQAQKTVVVALGNFDETARRAVADWKSGQLVFAGDGTDEEALSRARAALVQGARLVLLTNDAWRRPQALAAGQKLLDMARGESVAAAVGYPSDLGLFAKAPVAVASFSATPDSLKALGQALYAHGRLPGRLPASVTP